MESSPPKKLLDQVRAVIRLKHYSRRTEVPPFAPSKGGIVDWIRRYILFHHTRHPQEMGIPEIEAFLTHLAVQGNVAAFTQNQAFSALLLFYREVLKQELSGSITALRAQKPVRLPTVLTKHEARKIIGTMSGNAQLMAKMYSILLVSIFKKFIKGGY